MKLFTFDGWRDWKRLFFLFIILTCVGLVWSAYVYWQVESGATFYSDVPVTPVTMVLPISDIHAIEARYDVKAKSFKNYSVTASSTVIDPSL